MSSVANAVLLFIPVIPSIALCLATIAVAIAAIVLYFVNRKNYDLGRAEQGNPFNEVGKYIWQFLHFFRRPFPNWCSNWSTQMNI